ncbi:hypothetical protein HAX54_051540 [Datura stramonium]|uniref:Uncharacterized protein n=1 Tax=Datura stramonium TaxID=4076 RepID=A0ABS8RSY1_DATST|nr:hypothetical protein [Datura stramonium]
MTETAERNGRNIYIEDKEEDEGVDPLGKKKHMEFEARHVERTKNSMGPILTIKPLDPSFKSNCIGLGFPWTRDEAKVNMQAAKEFAEQTKNTKPHMESKERDEEGESQGESHEGQLTVFEEPFPLASEDPLSKKEIEDRASIRVQSNVLKLSRMFGAAFEGCDKAAFELFLKIDQKGKLFRQEKEASRKENSTNVIPKEERNLEFHMNFKDGAPRNRGRITSCSSKRL